MESPNKRESQQIAFNHSSHISFEGFMDLYKKQFRKLNSFLVIDTNLTSEDKGLHFRRNLLECTHGNQ